MPDIPIHNETEYTLTAAILDQIRRDALEYFGESIRSITVQYDIERHAFNAKTGALRYAFSPRDFGLVDAHASFPDAYYISSDVPVIDDVTEEEIDDTDFDDVDVEELGGETTSLESLEEDLDDEDEEDTEFHVLQSEFEETEDADEEGDFFFG